LGAVTASCCRQQKILGLNALPFIARVFIRSSQFNPANINLNGIGFEAVGRYYVDWVFHASAQRSSLKMKMMLFLLVPIDRGSKAI
jgi:hypothetical protein